MLNIAIIDDDNGERSLLSGYIDRFAADESETISIDTFLSGDSFISSYRSKWDILIFDVDMPGTNGIDAAREIRRLDANVVILFVTNMAQYAVNGYEVDAVDYIIKPISYYDFSIKFQKAVRRAKRREDHTIALEGADGVRPVPVSDICFVEVIGHYLIYHLISGEIKVRGSMREAEELIGSYNFIRTHKSYLVNMKHIENLRSADVMVEGVMLPVGRRYKDTLMQEYMAYLRG